jgi:V8-like Glu-specific endopeptidase
MINLTQLELTVFEVDIQFFNEEGEHYDSESQYVVVDPRDNKSYEEIVTASVTDMGYNIDDLKDCKVAVYEARTADFNIQLYKSGKIEFEATGDVDTATGSSGSPVYEV